MPSERTLLGEIVDIRDPLYEGRAKIRVFGFFEDIPIEDLPWAEQMLGISTATLYRKLDADRKLQTRKGTDS